MAALGTIEFLLQYPEVKTEAIPPLTHFKQIINSYLTGTKGTTAKLYRLLLDVEADNKE